VRLASGSAAVASSRTALINAMTSGGNTAPLGFTLRPSRKVNPLPVHILGTEFSGAQQNSAMPRRDKRPFEGLEPIVASSANTIHRHDRERWCDIQRLKSKVVGD
jgi:hypothetical protein